MNQPFPEVVGQRDPINLRLPVPLKKGSGILSRGAIGSGFSDKDEIALFGGQHHIVPIDHKDLAGLIADDIAWMQIGVTDDVGR